MNLLEALKDLDPTNDEHWTADGQAKTEVVANLLGEKVTRAMIRDAAPKFCRANTSVDAEPEVVQTSNPWESSNEEPALVQEPEAPAPVNPVDDIKPIVEPNVKREPVVVEMPDLEGLAEEIAEHEAELDELRVAKDKVTKAFLAKQGELDLLYKKRDNLNPVQQRQKQADALRAFIDQQNKNRMNGKV